MRLIFYQKPRIIAAITLCLSLLNLCIHGTETGSFLVSVLGLTAVVFYMLRVNYSRIVFYLWAACQLIVIRHLILQVDGAPLLTSYIFDLSQVFKLALYLPITIGSTHYELGLNFVALFFILLNHSISPPNLKGMELTFFPYRRDNDLCNVFPLRGRVTKYVTLSGETDWLLVRLNKVFQYKAMNIEYVLIKRNDKTGLLPGKTNQLVYFKLVPDPNMLREINDKADFPFEAWALCK